MNAGASCATSEYGVATLAERPEDFLDVSEGVVSVDAGVGALPLGVEDKALMDDEEGGGFPGIISIVLSGDSDSSS